MLAKFTWYTSSLIIALIFPVSVGIGLDCLAAAIIAHVTTEMAAFDRRDIHRWTQRERERRCGTVNEVAGDGKKAKDGKKASRKASHMSDNDLCR